MRTRLRSPALLAVLAGVWTTACGPSPERELLTRFFADSRLYDTAALSRTATVAFNPRVEGVVQEFEITNVGSERPIAGGAAKEVTIAAEVRSPGGQVAPRELLISMERRNGRWLVTAFKPLPASQTSRAGSSVPR
jgi:hypothetical protein